MASKSKHVPGSDGFVSPSMTMKQKQDIANDPATFLAEGKGHFLELYHIPSGESIKFKAYIEDYQDKYDSTWTDTEVYGRMDPIYQYQGTSRVISLDWNVPAISVAEAIFNHKKCGLLFSMLYPNYAATAPGGRSSSTQISTSPLFKIKFGNLIQDPSAGSGGTVEDSGLVGAISGFTYAPDLDLGFIDEGYGNLYPKSVKLSMEIKVMHTHALGWEGTSKRSPQFPYGDAPSPPPSGAGSAADEDRSDFAKAATESAGIERQPMDEIGAAEEERALS
jgi:hypothetical protein